MENYTVNEKGGITLTNRAKIYRHGALDCKHPQFNYTGVTAHISKITDIIEAHNKHEQQSGKRLKDMYIYYTLGIENE